MTRLRIGFTARLRRPLRLAALAGLAAMLFAQAALVLAACNLDGTPSRGMALAMTAPIDYEAQCHEQAPASDPLCAAHCNASDQTLDQYQAKLPVLPVHLLPAVQVRFNPPATVRLPPKYVPAASPPARILFQSLLI